VLSDLTELIVALNLSGFESFWRASEVLLTSAHFPQVIHVLLPSFCALEICPVALAIKFFKFKVTELFNGCILLLSFTICPGGTCAKTKIPSENAVVIIRITSRMLRV
jgi:hypothetical protein